MTHRDGGLLGPHFRRFGRLARLYKEKLAEPLDILPDMDCIGIKFAQNSIFLKNQGGGMSNFSKVRPLEEEEYRHTCT